MVSLLIVIKFIRLLTEFRSWGGTVPGHVATHLPPGSMHGAVYIASHPTLRTALLETAFPVFLTLWNARCDKEAAVSDFPVAFTRLCFSSNTNVSSSSFEESLMLNEEGPDFVPENPAASSEMRYAMMGMVAAMRPLHRRLVTEHFNEDDDILDLLGDGFPMLEVMGSHDAFMNCGKLVESLKPIARNLDVHVVDGASHTPFIDAPDEVMGAILKFAKKVHTRQPTVIVDSGALSQVYDAI